MNNLDRFIEYLVAGVFLCAGIAKILRYRRRPKPLGAQRARLPFGLPYEWMIAVGVFEICAALVLMMPLGLVPALTLLAAVGLGLITLATAIVHMRRHESPISNVALFLLVLLFAVGRWM